MSILSPFPNEVYRKDPEHQYYHNDGTRYISVSKFSEKFYKPFDSKGASYGTARKQLSQMGVKPSPALVAAQQKEVLEGWDKNRDDAADRGTIFHFAMETYLATGKITNPEWEKDIRKVAELFSGYYRNHTEIITYSEEYEVAGTADVISSHSVRQKQLLHINDFKTNAKGIYNDLLYNQWMYDPISHLIDTKYTRYAIQQSLYAYFLESHGYKIGSLHLIWINMSKLGTDDILVRIPIPYLKHDVISMLEHYKEEKRMPEESNDATF